MKLIKKMSVILLGTAFAALSWGFQSSEPAPFTVKLDGTADERIVDSTSDDAGNLYLVGYITAGAIPSFSVYEDDPDTTNTRTLSSNGIFDNPVDLPQSRGARDLFVAKFNWQGELEWVETAGGSGDDIASGIAYDRIHKQLFVSGYIKGNDVYFGLSPVAVNSEGSGVETASATNLFVATIDPVNHNWASIQTLPLQASLSGGGGLVRNLTLGDDDTMMGNGLALALDDADPAKPIVIYLKGRVLDSLGVIASGTLNSGSTSNVNVGLQGQALKPLVRLRGGNPIKTDSAGDWAFVAKVHYTRAVGAVTPTWSWQWLSRLDGGGLPTAGVSDTPVDICNGAPDGAALKTDASSMLSVQTGSVVKDWDYSAEDSGLGRRVYSNLPSTHANHHLDLNFSDSLPAGATVTSIKTELRASSLGRTYITWYSAAGILLEDTTRDSNRIVTYTYRGTLNNPTTYPYGSNFTSAIHSVSGTGIRVKTVKLTINYRMDVYQHYSSSESCRRQSIGDMAVDPALGVDSPLYLAGNWRAGFMLGGSTVQSEGGNLNGFVGKLNTSGITQMFANVAGRSSLQALQLVDNNGIAGADALMAGGYVNKSGAVLFDSHGTNPNISATPAYDASTSERVASLVAKMDTNGRWLWADVSTFGTVLDIEQTPDGDFLMTGGLRSDGHPLDLDATSSGINLSLDATQHGSSSPYSIQLDAGTYLVVPLSQRDGGAYTAFNAWDNLDCTDPQGCTSLSGYMNSYVVSSSNLTAAFVNGVPTPVTNGNLNIESLRYPSPTLAFANSKISTITLSAAGTVNFGVADAGLGDNSGGLSLRIIPYRNTTAYVQRFADNGSGRDVQWQKDSSEYTPDNPTGYGYRLHRNNLNTTYLFGSALAGQYLDRDTSGADLLDRQGTVLNVINTDNGDFLPEFQNFYNYVVGDTITPPIDGVESQNTLSMRKSLPEQIDIGLSTVAFFTNNAPPVNKPLLRIQANNSIYAAGPLAAGRIVWPTSDVLQRSAQPLVGRAIRILWPTVEEGLQEYLYSSTTDVVIPPVALNPEGSPRPFGWIHYAESLTGQPLTQAVSSAGGQLATTADLRSALVFFNGDNPAIALPTIVSTRSYAWNHASKHATATATIGESLVSPIEAEQDAGGYTMTALARYDSTLAVYDRVRREGQITPVNRNGTAAVTDDLLVAWYEHGALNIGWPAVSRFYDPQWPASTDLIILASQRGSAVELQGNQGSEEQNDEGLLAANNPVIYYQNDRTQAGFNPNEEHAFIRRVSSPYVVHAIRNDLNHLGIDSSDPYVLVRYQPSAGQTSNYAYRLFKVEYTYGDYQQLTFNAIAGSEVEPPTFLTDRIGQATNPNSDEENFWQDHNNRVWSRSGNTAMAVNYHYDLDDPSFWFDTDGDNIADTVPDGGVPWLAFNGEGNGSQALTVMVNNQWPENVPVIYVGESLIEARNDLPGVHNMQYLKVIYDDHDDIDQYNNPSENRERATIRLYNYEAEIRTSDSLTLPSNIAFALDGPRIRISQGTAQINLPARWVSTGVYDFPELPSDLRYRLRFQSLPADNGGYFYFRGGKFDAANGSDWAEGDPELFMTNVMTAKERDILKALDKKEETEITPWDQVVEALYLKSRNPNDVDLDDNGIPDNKLYVGFKECVTEVELAQRQTAGLNTEHDVRCLLNATGEPITNQLHHLTVDAGVSLTTAFATQGGTASNPSYVVLAENYADPDELNAQVNLHVIEVRNPIAPGAVNVLSNELNLLDTRVVLRQALDYAGRADDLEFEWYWISDTDYDPEAPLTENEISSRWTRLSNVGISGNASITVEDGLPLLSDGWVVSRYRGLTTPADLNGRQWTPFSGAPIVPGDPLQPVFVTGWVKRVMTALNEFDQRYTDFNANDVVTYTSMLNIAGQAYQGDVALTSANGNLNEVGLIELYQTVLNYARELSIDGVDPIEDASVNKQLLFATSRIASLYMLLGNEAYSDAQDPTIGLLAHDDAASYLQPSLFAFQNQLSSLLEEELTLLRGRDERNTLTGNHLLWNFSGGAEEATYVQVYGVSDVNGDGSINESDAAVLYPQGHGDAWGHYLTVSKLYYALARHPHFDWQPLEETLSFGSTAFTVDFRDEELFAKAAAAKANTGARIVDLSFRKEYTDSPSGQWQGYKDADGERAWGMDEWARRAGQGAFLDWALATALLPEHDDSTDEGIRHIDRHTVRELSALPAAVAEIDTIVSRADRGNNPFGLAADAIPFDISVSELSSGKGHFEQIYDRALAAANNSLELFDYANTITQQIRAGQLGNSNNQDLDAVQEREYKNRLIELMGYPYSGNIGPGKLYPTGYVGPDLYHFMYIDGDLPSLPASQLNQLSIALTEKSDEVFFPADVTGVADVNAHFSGDDISILYPTNTSGYPYLKPYAHWGSRLAPGEIQLQLGAMQLAQAKINTALAEQQSLIDQTQVEINLLESLYAIRSQQVQTLDTLAGEYNSLSNAAAAQQSRSYALQMAGESIYRGAGLLFSGFSMVNGLSNDMSWPARAGGASAFFSSLSAVHAAQVAVVATAVTSGSLVAASGGVTSQFGSQALAQQAAYKQSVQIQKQGYSVEAQRQLAVIENLLHDEVKIRFQIVELTQELENAALNYQQLVAEAGRVMEERVAFRKEIASRTAEERYKDMTYRVLRNDGLKKYRASFDLAAKYSYMAAKAFDYETGLLSNSGPNINTNFYSDLIRQRALGQFTDSGEPVNEADVGLSSQLAQMKQSYQSAKTAFSASLDPQEYSFSLRKQAYRILDGQPGEDRWQELLQNGRVNDLWNVREFGEFCVPPGVSAEDGPLPGIVLRFGTMIHGSKNLFGWDLGAGDSVYSPTYSSTKFYRVGLHFDGYDESAFTSTPYAYLVPVGMDVMRSPSNVTELRSFQVFDQAIPLPLDISQNTSSYQQEGWLPGNGTVLTRWDNRRRFSQLPVGTGAVFNFDDVIKSSRLVGRSVWNTEWLLIIPGNTLRADAEQALTDFIRGTASGVNSQGITDIRLVFLAQSYDAQSQ